VIPNRYQKATTSSGTKSRPVCGNQQRVRGSVLPHPSLQLQLLFFTAATGQPYRCRPRHCGNCQCHISLRFMRKLKQTSRPTLKRESQRSKLISLEDGSRLVAEDEARTEHKMQLATGCREQIRAGTCASHEKLTACKERSGQVARPLQRNCPSCLVTWP
jgi:hypothetical protein